MLWFLSSEVANLYNFRVWPGANLRLLPLLLLWALKKYFSVFPKTKLVSFTCDPRWFPRQSLRENFFLTRNAVDRSYRHCHLNLINASCENYIKEKIHSKSDDNILWRLKATNVSWIVRLCLCMLK